MELSVLGGALQGSTVSSAVADVDSSLRGHLMHLDLETLLSKLRKQDIADFAVRKVESANRLACFQAALELAGELRTNSLFTSDKRNERMTQLWDEYLAPKAPRRAEDLSPSVVHNYQLSLERSKEVPSARFPAWLLYPLLRELEISLKPELMEYYVQLKEAENAAAARTLLTASKGSAVRSRRLTMRREAAPADSMSDSPDETADSRYEATLAVRHVQLSGGASARSKYRDQLCVLDRKNALLTMRERVVDDANGSGSAGVQRGRTELNVLLCLLGHFGSDPAEFSLTYPGYRYDFRCRSAEMGQRWSRAIGKLLSTEHAVQSERIKFRNEILSFGTSMPLHASHYRTFAPVVMPSEQMEDGAAMSSTTSDAEADDDNMVAPSHYWSLPSVHLEAAQTSAYSSTAFDNGHNSHDDKSGTSSRSSDSESRSVEIPETLTLSEEEERRNLISSGGLYNSASMTDMLRGISYGSAINAASSGEGNAVVPNVGGYGGAYTPSNGMMAAISTTSSSRVTYSPAQVGYGAPPLAASLSYGSVVSASAAAATTERPYHEAVAFQYHGVAPGDGAEPVAVQSAAGDDNGDGDGDGDGGDDDNDDDASPVSFTGPRERFLSATLNSVSMTAYGDVSNVIRREEMALSKKMHRKESAPGGALSASAQSPATDNADDAAGGNDSEDEDDSDGSALAFTPIELARKTFGDYNGRFQDAMDHRKQLATKGGVGMADAQARVLGLADDFLESAKRYGRIVIDEAFVAPRERTIKPLSEGGNVYQVGKVLLELAMDRSGRFAPDRAYELAAKACGHKFKAMSAFMRADDKALAYPLVAIIDHRGLRLVAYSVLPINEETLIYGPLRGEHVDRSPEFRARLRAIGKELNIKPSWCCVGAEKAKAGSKRRQRVLTGFGLQAHQGTDKRLYVVEMADAFPTVKPANSSASASVATGSTTEKGAEFVRLFRPEFVAAYPKALSANAYKPSSMGMPDEEENRREIDEATSVLENVLVPACAKELAEMVAEQRGSGGNHSDDVGALRVNEFLHEYGLNVRYLGAVLISLPPPARAAHALLLTEMVARTAKNELRELWRRRSADMKTVGKETHRVLATNFLQLLFGGTPSSAQYWQRAVAPALQRKFGVSPQHWAEFPTNLQHFMLHKSGTRVRLFELLCSLTGLVCSDACVKLVASDEAYERQLPIFAFDSVVAVNPIIRQLDFVAEARGFLYQVRGAEHESRGYFQSARHYYSASVGAYQSALLRSPTNAALLRSLGEAVLKAARLGAAVAQGVRNLSMVRLDGSSTELRTAAHYLARAIKADASDPLNFGMFAHFYEALHQYDAAESLYLQALKVDPNHVHILVRYGQFLSHTRELYEVAEGFFNRAKELTAALSNVQSLSKGLVEQISPSSAPAPLEVSPK